MADASSVPRESFEANNILQNNSRNLGGKPDAQVNRGASCILTCFLGCFLIPLTTFTVFGFVGARDRSEIAIGGGRPERAS